MMMYRCINYRQCSGSELLLKGFHAKVTPVNNKELGRTFFWNLCSCIQCQNPKHPKKGQNGLLLKRSEEVMPWVNILSSKLCIWNSAFHCHFPKKKNSQPLFESQPVTLHSGQDSPGMVQSKTKKNSRRPQNCSGTSILRKSHPNHQPTQKFIIAKNLSNLKTESCFF